MPRTARAAIFSLFLLAICAGPAGADDPLSFDAQARALMSRGAYDQALEGLINAVSRYPYDQSLRRSLVSAYAQTAQRDLKLNRYAEAADYFGRAHDLSPGSTDLGLMRGIALYLGKNYDGARAEG